MNTDITFKLFEIHVIKNINCQKLSMSRQKKYKERIVRKFRKLIEPYGNFTVEL